MISSVQWFSCKDYCFILNSFLGSVESSGVFEDFPRFLLLSIEEIEYLFSIISIFYG